MNVTYITHYPELYGANRSLLDLMRELKRRGKIVPHVLLPREGDLVAVLREEGIPYRVLPFQPQVSERRYSGRWYHRLQQHWRYERAARARRKANEELLPVLADQVKAWGTGLVHANSSVIGIARDLAPLCGLPLVWHIREMPERQYGLHLDDGRSGYSAALREADRLIAISEAVREDILRYATPVRPIVVVPNGVLPASRYTELSLLAEQRWAHVPPFTFALVGLIHPSKGQMEAVEALAKVRGQGIDARLVIAGEGRDGPLRERIAALDMGAHVDMPGFVQDPYAVFLPAHCALMCSRNEAMGRVTVEAMASGLPVIGHRSGATPELVDDGVSGSLYDGVEDLAAHMATLAGNPARARSMGLAGAEIAAGRYSIERYADQVLDVYRAVLSER